ncbi:di-N-acetylchitobiase-like [Ruditapes philippinarum]|uniref:di-N-acetylchitobiase-like n=1 Tax=Ruditapes philippinarum TaxID=129788 RepID=UPI00295B39E8|nr:di-N-acetylchitobiase-like [Ruditapes philippinarum]
MEKLVNFKFVPGKVAAISGDEMEEQSHKTVHLLCSPCKRKEMNKKADTYCTDCQDYYCSACVKFNEDIPALSGHKILDKDTGEVETSVLPNQTARSQWVQKQLDFVDKNYLDGINFDYERAILYNQTQLRNGYTGLVMETRQAFREKFLSSMLMTLKALFNLFSCLFLDFKISVDVAWSPAGIDSRFYDYVKLSKASDYFFVMAYDEQSQILGECIAYANSGLERTMSGVMEYLEIGISSDKLILGVPWYGYYYPCLTQHSACVMIFQDDKCYLKKVPFRGVNCSDAAGRQLNYYTIIQLLKNSTSGRVFEKSTMTPYFNYKNISSGIMHQIRYDDPQSLGYKYTFAIDENLRGVGIWNTECVNYTSGKHDDIIAVKEMWDALPEYEK